MRKLICFFLLLAILTISCHKSHSDANFFNININGTTYTFDSLTAVVDTSTGSWNTLVYVLNTKTRAHAHFETSSDTKNVNGTYSYLVPPPSHYLLEGFVVVIPVTSSTALAYDLLQISFTLTINNSNNNQLQGSFTGTLNNQNGSSNTASVNGNFSMHYNYQ